MGGSITTSTANNSNAGGLVGYSISGTIQGSYSTALVRVSGNPTGVDIGGLVGHLQGGSITASYAAGAVSGGTGNIGGLVGKADGSATITNSYCDTIATDQTNCSGSGTTAPGKSPTQLQTPTGYTGIYLDWNLDLDGISGNDDPWTFGTSDQYPVLKYAGMDTSAQFAAQFVPRGVTLTPNLDTLIVRWNAVNSATGYKVRWKSGGQSYPPADHLGVAHGQARVSDANTTTYAIANLTNGTTYTVSVIAILQDMTDGDPSDEVMGVPGIRYDSDGNGLIEIGTLAQLHAMRWDLDGNGAVADNDTMKYNAAFPTAASGMGCPSRCLGYELMADLDFDENNDNQITPADTTYWNSGAGWLPIGTYTGRFKGNNQTISNLFISRASTNRVGLFSEVTGDVSGLGLKSVNVRGRNDVGGLVGRQARGRITACYVTGSVEGRLQVGGLVGNSRGPSPSERTVIATSYATAEVVGRSDASASNGGLVGEGNRIRVIASYAIGPVNSNGTSVGGLMGWLRSGLITASYARGRVTGGSYTGGLIGRGSGSGQVTHSYWDTERSGQSTSAGGTGKTTGATPVADVLYFQRRQYLGDLLRLECGCRWHLGHR